ncbi:MULTISPECIES: hypothetical protein [Nocardia]|jgi:hypothetical protein|nr:MULTISPECIES: hypothetical protein [Nocardia]MBC7300917.1 hypothetical protein [Nocardia sp.]
MRNSLVFRHCTGRSPTRSDPAKKIAFDTAYADIAKRVESLARHVRCA